jgi:hypothetical protein
MNNEQIKLCQTKPISRKPKMNLTPCSTITNNHELRTMNYQKQTQSKPILGGLGQKNLQKYVKIT